MKSDTSAATSDRLIARWRKMPPAEKFAVVASLNQDTDRMAEAGVKLRFPNASEREVMLRVQALRNGRDLSIAAFGWDPEIEGW